MNWDIFLLAATITSMPAILFSFPSRSRFSSGNFARCAAPASHRARRMGGFVCHFAESCPGRATGRRAHPAFAKRARPPLLVSRAAGRTDCSWLASFLGGLVHLGSSAAGHALSAHPSSLRPGAVGCQAKVRRVTRAGCFLAVLHAFAYFHPSKFTLTGRNLRL